MEGDLSAEGRPTFIVGESIMDPSSDVDEGSSNLDSGQPLLDEGETQTGMENNSESSNNINNNNKDEEESPPSLSENSNDQTKANKAGGTSKPPSRILTADTTHVQIEPIHIIEYEWPLKSGEYYFIQEQISQLLDVKSFKRKYPELSRRTVEPRERDHLLNQLNLGQSLPPHHLNHLTALQAVEVHDMMTSEHPAIHAEYKKCVAERIKQELLEKQKELDLIKSDAKKMEELRKKAIKSASEFNSELQTVKKSERKHFLDIQTSIIQSPANKWFKLSNEASKPSAYPVALIPGQYTSHFKEFSSDKLSRLPLNSVTDSGYLYPPKRELSPLPIHVSEQEVARRNAAAAAAEANHSSPFNIDKEESALEKSAAHCKDKDQKEAQSSAHSRVLRRSSTSTSVVTSGRKTRKFSISNSEASVEIVSSALCSICGLKESVSVDSLIVKCAICLQHMHSGCIDMPFSMVSVVQKYSWSCIDCKMCDVCNKPDQEDAMMCCDLCDRGYHTFCVGLAQPPCGAWICGTCQLKNE